MGVPGERPLASASASATDAGIRPDELVVRALAASARLHSLAESIATCSAERQAAVRDLRDRFGWSHQQVADALSVSRAQAQSIYEGRSASGTVSRGRSPQHPAVMPAGDELAEQVDLETDGG